MVGNGSPKEAPRVLESFSWFEVESDDPDAEVDVLLKRLDKTWQDILRDSGLRKQDLIEVFLQLGRRPKAIFDTGFSKETVFLTRDNEMTQREHIQKFIENLDWQERLQNSKVKSACLPTTLHRISLITKGEGSDVSVIGLNARVGRSWTGVLMQMCPWLINEKNMRVAAGLPTINLAGKSVLFIGRPGAGKTTLLREMAHALSRPSNKPGQDEEKTVVVVDKINEIAGDFEVPHACIGEARWMPCGSPDMHGQVMREAVEHGAPDIVIVDEISNAEEVGSCQVVAERGVSLVATVHGNTVIDVLKCSVRQGLLGVPSSRQRESAPAFDVAIELHQKDRWILHPNLRYTVDTHLQGEPVEAVELRPGLAIATLGIPVEYGLNYCYDCTSSTRCELHQLSRVQGGSRAPSPAPPNSTGTLSRLPNNYANASLLDENRTLDNISDTRSPRQSKDGSVQNPRPTTPRGSKSTPQPPSSPRSDPRSGGKSRLSSSTVSNQQRPSSRSLTPVRRLDLERANAVARASYSERGRERGEPKKRNVANGYR